MRDRITMIVGVLVVLWAAWATYQYTFGTDHLEARIDSANERADDYELVAQTLRSDKKTLERAYRELAHQAITEGKLRRALAERNEALEDSLEGTLQTLQEVRMQLEAEADSSESTVERDGGDIALSLDERVYFDASGYLRVAGRVDIQPDPPEILGTDLAFDGEIPLTVVLAREANDDLSVTAYTGDPRLTVSQLDVIQNVRDPLVESEREGFFGALLGQVFDPGPWVNRGLGAGLMCLATCD